jgi:hypothetical protein
MPDEIPAITREDVREEAYHILSAIAATRRDHRAFEQNWRKLWQLVREARAAYFPLGGLYHGPWRINSDPGLSRLSPRLIAVNFMVSIWPAEEQRSGADLLGLLNWAGVLPPDGRQTID